MITHEERKMLYGSLPSNKSRARLIAPSAHRCFRQRQAPPNGQHFLSPLRFAPSIHDIGSLIQKYRKKIGFWRNYYSYKLIWPCRSVGLERWGDLKIRPQPSRSSHCFITVVLFSVKLKQNSEMLQNQSIKKMSTELFPRHRYFLHPHVHHGRAGSGGNGVGLAEPAVALDGFDTHTQEMVNASITESVLFPLKQGKWGGGGGRSGMPR